MKKRESKSHEIGHHHLSNRRRSNENRNQDLNTQNGYFRKTVKILSVHRSDNADLVR